MYLFIVKSCEVSFITFSNIESSPDGFVDLSLLEERRVVEHHSNTPTKEELDMLIEKSDYLFFFEPLIKGKRVNYQSLTELGIEEKNILKSVNSLHLILSSLPEQEEVVFIDFSKSGDIISFLTKTRLFFRRNTSYIFDGGYSSFFNGEFAIDFNPYDSPSIAFDVFPVSQRRKYISFVEELCYIASRYISLSFDKGETHYFDDISDYFIFNLQAFPMKSLIERFHLFPPYEYRRDIPIDEFIISEDYRKILTEYVCKVVARIAVHSNFPVKTPENEKHFYDEKFYLKIHSYLVSLL